MRKLPSVLLICALLGACAQPGQQGYGEPGTFGMNKSTGGALVGAGAGGLLGSQFGGGSGKGVATVLGVLAGGLLGSQVGASLDRADQAALQNATQSSLERLPVGQSASWRNPDNGHYGTVTPVRTYEPSPGQVCREFQQMITVGGQTQQGYGTACRQPDGSWRITQ
jgi:surface antigen